MHFSFYIARRYLFSKKKHHAINIISGVAVCGIALATMALVCTLSVFNGFQEMVTTLFTDFDPQLKITAAEGKVFVPEGEAFERLRQMPEVEVWTETLEENAMVQYKDRQTMATIKGVSDNFSRLTRIDSLLVGAGRFMLHDEVVNYGVPGLGLIAELGCGLQFVDPLHVYAPKRNVRINIANPAQSFVSQYLYSPGCAFLVNQQDYDSRYLLTSLDFARHLFLYQHEVSAIELKLTPETDEARVKEAIALTLGQDYLVQNRYEQQADVFRIMEVEKLISYLFLTFILAIACFNVISSLSMLILDKRDDIQTLRSLGASERLVTRIFLAEGRLITLLGAVAGIGIGVLLCLAQQHFGLISLGSGAGEFVVSAYPVSVHLTDLAVIFVTVVAVGFIAVWYPVRHLSKQK